MGKLKIQKRNLLLLFILLSPAIHLFISTRYGVRIEQLLGIGFICIVFPIIVFNYPKAIKKELIILLSFLWFFPIFFLTTEISLDAFKTILGMLRYYSFGIIGFFLIKKTIHLQLDQCQIFYWFLFLKK